SVGLGEINVGVTQLDQVTQQNAAMVEEATAASTTLRHEAETLQGLVARFRLQGGTGTRPTQTGAMTPLRLVDRARPTQEPAPAATVPQAERLPRAAGAETWKDF
ncbi:methyl-accepting chemotaxis protein (MCP) signaling protein, partial [Rhodovulum steppense]